MRDAGSDHTSPPPFAHPVERALAKLFDRHRIRWHYEPHEFELERDGRGQTTRAFRPDFFLPELDLYVECTMMKQSHTTRKNGKVRRAQQQHGIVVAVLYRRDLERLGRRHGLDLEAA